MYFKILDSVSSVEKKVNLAISEEINKRIRKNLVKLKPEVQSFIGDSIINQPEMVSLVGGYLRGAFGLVTPELAVNSIIRSVRSSVYVDFRKYDDKLRGGLTVNVQPSDLASLLSLPEGHVIYSKGDLHWLRWLLEYGDTIIVANYDYNPQTGLGRSSLGNMKDGTGFRVPPEFSGTLTNNFITRALTDSQQEKRIYNILKRVLL